MRPVHLCLLVAASTVSAKTGCAGNTIEELVAFNPCGDSSSISKCLGEIDSALGLDEVVPCFTSGGCSKDDAVWFAQECNAPNPQELKKRADDTTTTAKTTAKNSAKSTSATTTVDSTTSSASVASTASTASSTTSTTTSSGTTTGTTSLICFTSSSFTTTQCPISTNGDLMTSNCPTVTVTTSKCAPGMLCFTPTTAAEASGDDCMVKQDSLTTSGIVVTVIFALALSGTIIGLIVLRRIETRQQKRDKLAREIALSGGMDDEAKPYRIGGGGDTDASIPLVAPGGARSEDTGPEHGYFDAPQGDVGSTSSEHPPQIQLHQGVLGLDHEEHWSNDYAARS